MTWNRQCTDEAEPLVFVVDDDPSVRRGLSRLLASAGFRSETFASAEEFLGQEPYHGLGCIILDVRMPGLTGTDLQDLLSQGSHPLPIIFITGHGSIPMGVKAMKKGASDFLPKPFDDHDILRAVAEAIERHKKVRRADSETAYARECVALLTAREKEIFMLIVDGKLNKQVAYSLGIAEKTVKVHRGRIMEKLKVSSVADLVRLAERVGLGTTDMAEPGTG